MTTVLETKRLLLRHFILDDLHNLLMFYSHSNVTTGLSVNSLRSCHSPVILRTGSKYIPEAPRTYEEVKEELEWFMNGHPKFPELGLWATFHKETGQFIGRCGLLPWTIDGQKEVEVAFALSKAYWSQGLGTGVAQALVQYGFEHLQLSRLIGLIDQGNQDSIKVATKIGMSFEKEGQDEKGPFLMYALKRD